MKQASGVLCVAAVCFFLSGCGDDEVATSADESSPQPKPAKASTTVVEVDARQASVRRFDSVQEAADFITERTGLLASTPAGISNRAEARASAGPGRRAQLSIYPKGPALVVQYGSAGFDGCEPPDYRSVEVRSQPALLSVTEVGKNRPYGQLIWPAEPDAPIGTYGLSGEYSPAELIEMAKSMPLSTSADPGENDVPEYKC